MCRMGLPWTSRGEWESLTQLVERGLELDRFFFHTVFSSKTAQPAVFDVSALGAACLRSPRQRALLWPPAAQVLETFGCSQPAFTMVLALEQVRCQELGNPSETATADLGFKLVSCAPPELWTAFSPAALTDGFKMSLFTLPEHIISGSVRPLVPSWSLERSQARHVSQWRWITKAN